MNPFARRNARHFALQAMYQWQMTQASTTEIENQFIARQINKKTDLDYFKELISEIPKQHEELDSHMIPFLSRPIQELDPIELAILRLSIYELAKRLDIPYRVVINEALELTKKFGSVEGYKFVNGVLDQVARKLRTHEVASDKKEIMLHEFDIIQKFFTRQSVARDDVILGIGDDAAIVEVPSHQQLIITTDTLITGVHFPENTSAYDIGFKALAVNLSDLAAMGATPAWITLALTIPKANEIWLNEFSQGLFELAARYKTQLIGGDLTRGPLSVTIQACGFVPKNQALKRDQAKVGDLIYVTNTLGEAALALEFLYKKIQINSFYEEKILAKLNRPEPRIVLGEKLRGVANAVIDISSMEALGGRIREMIERV